MQTEKDIVLVFWPEAKFILHPGGSGADSNCIGVPRTDGGSFNLLSDCLPLDMSEERVWGNAYIHLIERSLDVLKDALVRLETLRCLVKKGG